jgi:hypothetical protein
MASSGQIVSPPWVNQIPSAYDIVTAWYPETKPKPGLKRLRPCLVTKLLQNDETGEFACVVAFGTKHLKVMQRSHLDIIVQNAVDIPLMGLAMATRFDLDSALPLPWSAQFFGCWSGMHTPILGRLTQEYIKDYAYKMLARGSAQRG